MSSSSTICRAANAQGRPDPCAWGLFLAPGSRDPNAVEMAFPKRNSRLGKAAAGSCDARRQAVGRLLQSVYRRSLLQRLQDSKRWSRLRAGRSLRKPAPCAYYMRDRLRTVLRSS
jgi:hypothetical protein